MSTEAVPMDEKAKRMRDLLSSFYAPDPSISTSGSSISASFDNINSTSFDADQYMDLMIKKSNLEVQSRSDGVMGSTLLFSKKESIASEICGFITMLTGTVILHATKEEEQASPGRMRWQDSGKSFDEEHLTSLYSPEY